MQRLAGVGDLVGRSPNGCGMSVLLVPKGQPEMSRWWSEQRAQPPDPVSNIHPPRQGRWRRCHSVAPPGRCPAMDRIRWFRYAPPPANFQRPSGPPTATFVLKLAPMGRCPGLACRRTFGAQARRSGLTAFRRSGADPCRKELDVPRFIPIRSPLPHSPLDDRRPGALQKTAYCFGMIPLLSSFSTFGRTTAWQYGFLFPFRR